MSKQFRSCDLNQAYLLPPSPQDWVPEGLVARFVADVVDQLDLSEIYARYEEGDRRGLAAYHPVIMARLPVYGYCQGVVSSRRIKRGTWEDVAFRYLAADQHPDHDTIAALHPTASRRPVNEELDDFINISPFATSEANIYLRRTPRWRFLLRANIRRPAPGRGRKKKYRAQSNTHQGSGNPDVQIMTPPIIRRLPRW